MTQKTPDIFAMGAATLPVAMCQILTREWDLDGNLERTLAALEAAADAGARLAITPECVLHGYGFEPDRRTLARRMAEAAEPLDGPRLAAIRALLRRRALPAVVGFAERAPNGAFHNSAALIDADGELRDVYRKVHCRDFEADWGDGVFTPGHDFHVVALSAGDTSCRLGTMICFDREVPESVRCLRALGAELIACPLATDTTDLRTPGPAADQMNNELITRCRSAENEVFIAVVNHAGRFNGGSFVTGPGGELIVQMGPEPGVEVVELPVGAVTTFHAQPYGWMGHGFRRPEVYRPHLDRDW